MYKESTQVPIMGCHLWLITLKEKKCLLLIFNKSDRKGVNVLENRKDELHVQKGEK